MRSARYPELDFVSKNAARGDAKKSAEDG